MKLANSSPGCIPTYSTYLGSSYQDFGDGGISVGADGSVYVTGSTRLPAAPDGSDFPVTPGAFDTTGHAGGLDVFVARLRPDGYGSADLLYSTFLGGSGDDSDGPVRLALDSSEAILVTGPTQCSDFPTTPGAFDVSCDGPDGSFVSRLVPAGNGAQDLAYSTFLEGIVTHDIAIDQDDAVYVMGGTLFYGPFPTTLNAFDTGYNGGTGDLAMSKLVLGSAGPRDLVYSTYIGGAGSDACYNRCGIAVDSSGVVYVAGYSSSSDFPVSSGAYDTSYNSANDAIVVGLVLPPQIATSIRGDDAALTWTHATPYTSYEIWRHTSPYFDAVSPPATLVASGLPLTSCTLVSGDIACSLAGGIGDSNTNYFYLVRGIRSDGTGANSNRTGEFDFALVPGN